MKNDNAHSIRLVNSLKLVSGELAEKFEIEHPLSKSASVEKKFDWAVRACEFLEDNLTDGEILETRMRCPCNDGVSISDKLAKHKNKSSSVREFVDKFNAAESFAFLEYISENSVLFCYPECYCSCVKRVPQNISKTWCLCTLGNVKAIFERLLKTEVSVELIESVKLGDARCAVSVSWL